MRFHNMARHGSALKRLKQEDYYKFKARLGDI